MILKKKSLLSGVIHTMEIPLTKEEVDNGVELWTAGMYIQDAFPTLNEHERDFIKTGITPEEWDKAFPDKEDYEDDHIHQ